jgi:hypothetical protein
MAMAMAIATYDCFQYRKEEEEFNTEKRKRKEVSR